MQGRGSRGCQFCRFHRHSRVILAAAPAINARFQALNPGAHPAHTGIPSRPLVPEPLQVEPHLHPGAPKQCRQRAYRFAIGPRMTEKDQERALRGLSYRRSRHASPL